MKDRDEIDELWERVADATQTLLDGCLVMEDATRDDFVDGLFDALMGIEQNPERFSIDDPTARRRAHAMVKRILPGLATASHPEFVAAFESFLKLGNEAQQGRRELVVELVLRIIAAFEFERERRGFKSFGEMRERVAAPRQPSGQDRDHDGTIH